MLARDPGFALVGILSLGLGIGVSTVEFGAIQGMMLRDAPGFTDPDALVMTERPASYPYFEHYRDDLRTNFDGAAAFLQSVPFSIAEPANPQQKWRVSGHVVSPEYFQVLGVKLAARGRLLSPEQDRPGSTPGLVVSERFWRERLNADPNAVGRTLLLNGNPVVIAGVAMPGFLGVMPFFPADLFLPATVPPSLAPELGGDVLHRRDRPLFRVILRKKPVVPIEAAEIAIDAVRHRLDEESLDPERDAKGRQVHLLPGGKVMPYPRESTPILYGFYGTLMGLLLTIACMNLSNMLLAQAASRRKEIAIRLAIGATRVQLVRQLLTESLVIAMAGCAAGVLFAYWLARLLTASFQFPTRIPYQLNIQPDLTTLAFSISLSVLTAVMFGLAPALETVKSDLASTLKQGGAVLVLRGRKRLGMRNVLMVVQVAASLIVLMLSGWLILGLRKSSAVTGGVDVARIAVFSLDPVRDGYSNERTADFFNKLRDRLTAKGGGTGEVQNVAYADRVPFAPDESILTLRTQRPSAATETTPVENLQRTGLQAIGEGFFATLGLRPLRGREFSARDIREDKVALLNEPAAKMLFGGRDPLGERIAGPDRTFEVAGVVPELRSGFSLNGETPVIYVPLSAGRIALPRLGGVTVLVRSTTAHGSADALETVRRDVAAIDPNLSVFATQTLEQVLNDLDAFMRMGAEIYLTIGLFGLTLASLGLAGVTAYSVVRRRKEIGIRVALGAKPRQVIMLVLRESFWLVVTGLVCGFAGAVALARAMGSMTAVLGKVFTSSAGDPRLLIGAPLLLAGVALVACLFPARRATGIDPLVALREE